MDKTKKAASSRFRLNKKGTKIKMRRSGRRHLLAGKSRSRKRRLRRGTFVNEVDVKAIRRLLPHG
jgi:large subunit ribosomal protein L35